MLDDPEELAALQRLSVHDQVGVSADNQIVTAERGERPYTTCACLAAPDAVDACGKSLQTSQTLVHEDVSKAAPAVCLHTGTHV